MPYYSTKTYGHERGLSCTFRQWRAKHSHCQLLHGYALSVHLEFRSDTLDSRNWVMDFGGLGGVETWLKETFDHTLIVADDDPNLPDFLRLQQRGLARVKVFDTVGCEAFAEIIHENVCRILNIGPTGGVSLSKVQVKEHGANGAIYEP